MRRIIYRSIATPGLDKAEMFRLVYHARVANEAKGLTGVLLQAGQHLLQILEGPTWKLFATFETIRRDMRHSGVEVLFERSIPEATFPHWPMRYFDDHHIGKALTLMHEEAGERMCPAIAEAVRDFFVHGFAAHQTLKPSPPEAARPSFPKPC
ncbi:BLUF domain-containing protein [Porphyrobacter sp. AAP82]|uniref:BLUF domain-containing protein n=1 Tax=Porphyrobacter sp. AAP82 TaxID=1248917 RepID=UPI000316408A|nr:BLUF domain-containing protein [Porphyrobacter sp. AAP82]